MPVEAKKKLYIGKTLSDLNKQIEKDVDKKDPKRLTGLSGKMLSAADLAYKSLDEERAYILFMRYVFIWKVLRGSAEYKNNSNYYNDLFGTKNIKRAIDRAAELSDSLEHRYQDRKEEEELKGKLAKEAEETTVNGDADGELQNGNEIPEEKTLGTNGCLQAKDLYDVILGKDFSVLVMDVRSSDQYSSSQIKDVPSINVPMDIIKAGATVMTIQKGLPADSRQGWNRRGDHDYVILLDWDSTVGGTKHGSTLSSLKDALYKWDSSRVLKHEPLILEGGYADWILRYPMYSTNSRVTKPPSYESLVKPKGSLDFDYPDLEDKPPAPPQNQEPDTPVLQAIQSEQILPPASSIPSVNRTLKPQTNSIQPSLPNGGIKVPALSKGGGSIQENGQNRSMGGPMQTTVTSPTSEQTRQVTPAAPVTQHNGDIHLDLTRPQMPSVDRSSKPQKVVDVKGSATDVPDSDDGPEETTKNVPSPEERLQEEKEEQAEVVDRQELERLKLKEEEVRGQLDKMRTEKTRLENSELKKENQALEEKIKQHQEEMTRLKTEMEAHKTRLKSKPIPKTEKVTSKSISGSSPTKANTSDGGGKLNNLQPSSQSSNRSDKSKPSNVKPADKTTVNLPPGWEMKWDDNKQRYFYIDHGTKTSHWELPANVKGVVPPSGGEQVLKQTVGKEQPKPDSLNLAKPAASTSPEKHSKGTTRVPLKSESAEFPGQTTLKRSFSSPNIAKMVVDEEQSRKIPAFDRGQKPANRPTPAQSYNQHQLVVRKRNLDPVYGSQARALTGLRNLGNTCFMNSVVQCLSNTSLLTKYFLEDAYLNDINQKNPLGRKGEVAAEFAVVVKALWAGQYKSIAPRDLLRTVIKYVPEFNQKIGHHHDSQEFLVFLMDGLHEDLNQVLQRQYVKEEDFSSLDPHVASQLSWKNHLMLNRSIIVGLFQGQFRSVVTCLHCGNESVKYEAFMFLELPIPSRTKCTLQDCIEKFQSEEKLAGDNATLCSKCKRLRDSVKCIQICKLPTILIIHLKRFYFEGMWRQKLQTNIDYPVTSLDMRRFTSHKSNTGNGLYNLYAVSNHTGTLDGGHYTAYCKSAVNQRWYKYDDTDVYEYSVGKIRSTGAYILFYTAVQLREP